MGPPGSAAAQKGQHIPVEHRRAAAEAGKAGEPTGIARWDFLLPEIGKTVKLEPIK